MRKLQEKKVAVPEQISILSYGGNEWNEWVTPSLTTLRLPIEEMEQCLRSASEYNADDRRVDTDIQNISAGAGIPGELYKNRKIRRKEERGCHYF